MIYVRMPAWMIDGLDRLQGQGQRSRLICMAVAEKLNLAHMVLGNVLDDQKDDGR